MLGEGCVRVGEGCVRVGEVMAYRGLPWGIAWLGQCLRFEVTAPIWAWGLVWLAARGRIGGHTMLPVQRLNATGPMR